MRCVCTSNSLVPWPNHWLSTLLSRSAPFPHFLSRDECFNRTDSDQIKWMCNLFMMHLERSKTFPSRNRFEVHRRVHSDSSAHNSGQSSFFRTLLETMPKPSVGIFFLGLLFRPTVGQDRFNYRSTEGRDFGPEDWSEVQCDDITTCVRSFESCDL